MAKEITLKQGETHELYLDANATTGFSWEHEVDNPALVSVVGNYEPDPNPNGMCGKGGKHHYRIKAEQAGKCVITFVYAQPWNKSDTARSEKYTVTIN